VTRAYTDSEIGDMAALARKHGVALEINSGAVLGDPALARRVWNLGKEAGATFHFGTDAHSLDRIDTKTKLGKIKRILL
jgi:histidinol phosphatase-like PHP family hydrolase